MKRISLILASLALVFGGTKASAHVGGPFDNGDYSILLDNGGVYQVALRFSNGSGFAQFANNVDVALFTDVNTGGATIRGSTYSVLNRSIVYYKGVSYLGTCIGMVDHTSKIVDGVTNANSDVQTSAVTATGFGATGTNTTAATSTLQNNGGSGLTCNTNWKCKITNSYPVLRFSGKGEISILNPSLGQVTLQAISAIINGGGQQNQGGGNIIIGIQPDSIGDQIADVLNAVANNQAAIEGIIPTAQAIRDNSDHAPLTAFGSRIFFVRRQ